MFVAWLKCVAHAVTWLIFSHMCRIKDEASGCCCASALDLLYLVSVKDGAPGTMCSVDEVGAFGSSQCAEMLAAPWSRSAIYDCSPQCSINLGSWILEGCCSFFVLFGGFVRAGVAEGIVVLK